MNIYRIFIVVALAVKFLLELISEWLNIRSLRPELPEELKDFYDPQQYSAMQAYTRARTRLGIVESISDLTVLLFFWFAGGFNRLDQMVRSFGYNSIATGVIYLGLITIAGTILSLPFSTYSTFVIEERFGFNRTTVRTFVLDRVKGFALAVALGVPLLCAVLWFFQYAGRLAWLYCWIVSAAVTLVLQFVAPVWILPIFNKFEPLAEGELKSSILQYLAKTGLTFEGVFVMDGSRRSSKANAFLAGFGRHRRIALYDTLIEQHTVRELIAVLAHEIGHLKHKHVVWGVVVAIAHSGIVFFLMSLFLNNRSLFDAFYMEQVSIYGSLLFFAIMYEPLSFILSLALNALSRKHEREADCYAARTVDDVEEMISALKKLSVKNLSNLVPHPFYVFLHYSHPPLIQRIKLIREVSAQATRSSPQSW